MRFKRSFSVFLAAIAFWGTAYSLYNLVLFRKAPVLLQASADLAHGKIVAVDIYYMPLSAESPTRLTSKEVFALPPVKRISKATPEAVNLSKVLDNARIREDGRNMDVREGLIAYDVNGKRVLPIAVGRGGCGDINGRPVRFSRGFPIAIADIADPARYDVGGWGNKVILFLLEHC